MRPIQPQILFTDLDGTLLNSQKAVSEENLATLKMLGALGTVRVIATGRSLYSFNLVMPADFPADYIIFSSGAGILDFATKSLLFSTHLDREDVSIISEVLDTYNADHMIHYQVPDNHRFIYRRRSGENDDFERRIELYHDFAENGEDTALLPSRSAQVIAVLPPDQERFLAIKSKLNGYHTIRTTSPLDHRSLWLEVYPAGIHKGSGAAWLCKRLGISRNTSIGIGNDFNDIDLLDFTAHSFVVGNSPAELHGDYTLTRTSDDDGFSAAVSEVVDFSGR